MPQNDFDVQRRITGAAAQALLARLGANSGEVVVGKIGGDLWMDDREQGHAGTEAAESEHALR